VIFLFFGLDYFLGLVLIVAGVFIVSLVQFVGGASFFLRKMFFLQ